MNPITLTIPAIYGTAPGVASYQGAGKYFKTTAISGPLSIVTNLGQEYDFSEAGSAFGNAYSSEFGKLTFYNSGSSPVTITFYVGNTPINTPDATVNSSVTVNTSLSNTLAGCSPATMADAAVNAGNANQAYAFGSSATLFRNITVLAYKAFGTAGNAPTANAGTVYIGVSASRQPIALAPGGIWTFSSATGAAYNLANFYLSAATPGDGVLIILD